MRRTCLWTPVALLASLLGSACLATPVPEPPADALDFGLIHSPEVSPATNVIAITGEPGAGPAGHMLRVTNLDGDGAPVDVAIGADGSFSLEIAGGQGDELRFHTRFGRTRAEPSDIVWSAAEVADPERVACLTLVPLQQQDFGFAALGAAPTVQTLSLHNGCDASVTVTGARLRRTGSDFALGSSAPTLPADVAPGDGLSWPLELVATSVGDREEIFFLELTYEGSPVRYPITLYGDGR